MSAPLDVSDARVPDAPPQRRNARLSILLTAFALGAMAFIALRLAGHGYQARATVELISAILGTGEGIQLDFLDSLGRAFTVATLLIVETAPGLSSAALPLITVGVGAAFLGAMAYRLDRQGWPGWQTLAVVISVLCHPLFLKAATSGTTVLLGALAFFVLMYAIERLEHIGDVQAQMNVGLALGGFVLVDPQMIYYVVPLLPLLPILYREVRGATSGAAALLMVGLPPLIGLAAFVYLHVAFSPHPLSRPFQLWDSPLHGAVVRITEYDWLMHFGDRPAAAFGMLLLGSLACVPAQLIVVWRLVAARAERNRPGSALSALFLPVVAGTLATGEMHARSAWPYLLAALMAILVWLSTKPLPDYVRWRAVVLLAAGTLAAWMYPPIWAERGADAWRAALVMEIKPAAAWPAHQGAWFSPRHVTHPLHALDQ